MIDKLRQLFINTNLSHAIHKAIKKAKTIDDMVDALDNLKTKNEIALHVIDGELEIIDRAIILDGNRIKNPNLSDRKKKLILQRIRRYGNEIEVLDKKTDIHDKNIMLLQNIIGKIMIMESMAMQGLEDDQIDQVVVEFQMMINQYNEAIEASDASSNIDEFLTAKDRNKLRNIEQELEQEFGSIAQTQTQKQHSQNEIELE